MKPVTPKFQHFTGPYINYQVLDANSKAKNLEQTLYCNIDDYPSTSDCEFDVTFSYTVLEHSKRPQLAFDTFVSITKGSVLNLYLLPFLYQYHAIPEDYHGFSHASLITLLKNYNSTILEVGYNICNKPKDKLLGTKVEHYKTIQLTYIIAQEH